MKKVHLVSGKVDCSESIHLAACLERFFQSERCVFVGSREEADVAVLNGCERIAETPEILRTYRDFARRHPGKRVLIVGCVPDAAKAPRAPKNFHVLPSWRLAKTPELIGPALGFSRTFSFLEKDEVFQGRFPVERIPGDPAPSEVCFLTIGSGCRSRCAYCSIKDGRGPSRSIAPEKILADARTAAAKGRFRFVLLSDDAGSWGYDLGLILPDLLKRLRGVCPQARFLIRPMNPVSLPGLFESLLPWFDSIDYLYLPLQAGSDRVLKLMRRGYRAGDVLAPVRRLRAEHPGIYLETDVIVGFPTETRAEFRESLEAASAFHHAAFHRFTAYPDTPAWKMAGKVPAGEMSVRMELVRRLGSRRGFTTVDPSSFCYELGAAAAAP